MLGSPFPQAFGLDISDLSIKLVQLYNNSVLYKKPCYNLVTARVVDLPPGLIVDGEILQPEPVRKYIRHLITGNKSKDVIHSPWVVASVPEKKSFLKLITLPKRAEDIIDDDVSIAAKQHVPFENDSYYIDWQIIPSDNTEETTVLMAVVAKQTADMYTYLLESVGLGVVALEVESLAIARSMITAKKLYDGEARAILDIGGSKTVFLVYDNDSIQFSTVLPYAGNMLTNLLKEQQQLSMMDAEKLKKQIGLKHDPKQEKVWRLLLKETESFVKDITKATNFYYSHFPNAHRITHITMCGGGSAMQQLEAVLAEQLNISIAPGQPWKNLFSKHPIAVSESLGLRYATAIGLALRAADNPFFRYDTI